MLQVFQPGPRTRENSTEKSEAQSHPSGMQIAARRDFSEDSMKRVFLLIVVPALLVAMGFAQTPAASGNTDQINVKGCLGGSEGSYNVAEDSTGKIFRITTSSADLKAYRGQEVLLIGHKAGTADDGLAVTEVKMITEHCAAAAAVPAAAVSAPAETSATPPAAPAAAVAGLRRLSAHPPLQRHLKRSHLRLLQMRLSACLPRQSARLPADRMSPDAAAPLRLLHAPAPQHPAAAAAPAATVSTPVETASAPAAAAGVHRTRPSHEPRKLAATPAAAAASG